MEQEKKTYSILVHLRRVVYEDAYVSVPVNGAIIKGNPDGAGSIDTDALWAEAIRLSQHPQVEWKREESQTQPHPLQGPIPEGRSVFSPLDSQPDTTATEANAD